ncbi:MAG: methylmalonyl Co-A mutase-associated GTPase MeaB, partial [Tannerellaceae bacterium]
MEHPENDPNYKGLKVNKGIEMLPSVNPYLKSRKKVQRRHFTPDQYVEGILKGDITILS